ncbi:MAG: cation-transporting P-type ATPase [Rhodospirillales bacterium]|nr:cation-transporting P-type ATPase [Rhodospirillales bacterium]
MLTDAHSRTVAELLKALDVTSEAGLDEAEVARRYAQHGPNRLEEKQARSAWAILLAQFKSPVVILLLIAAATAAAFGQVVESIAIAAALLINAVIGFVTEFKAMRSMEALSKMGRTTAAVIRGGARTEIDAAELVPGDIVILEEGNVVPADLRLVDVGVLHCNESALTGESVPVSKSSNALDDDDPPLAERANMAFSSTAVTRGEAIGVVVATGTATEIGKISEMVSAAEDQGTPLERRLEHLGQRLIYLVIAVGIVVAVSGIIAGKELFLMVETAIILAIAAVPEGLPIVATVALGRGMWRMARRNALVKELSAVETLGATTVIFTDKTGTLTENRMTLHQVALPAGNIDVVRTRGLGEFQDNSEPVDVERRHDLQAMLRAGVLCTNAALGEGEPGNEQMGSRGDPTEVALLEAAAWAGMRRRDLIEALPEEREESFGSETKMMATYHRTDDGAYLVAVKGAPESVLRHCTHVRGHDGGDQTLSDDARQEWLQRNRDMAARGLRVLAMAERTVNDAGAEPYRDLALLGLVGLYDPPRESVKGAIAACRGAGIRVVMVTGDQPETAANIAHAIGIVDEKQPSVLRGRDLGDLDAADEQARERIWKTSIFARVSPEQKLNLVSLYQDEGEIVGMTGDGVNDAPALKKADIGIAMGKRGTEVARETSDVVLQDDAFETIVMAIEQGRAIFSNIRKFVVFLLSGNLGQIIAVSAAALMNAPLPLLPLQILFLNLLLDVFPALAIGVSKSESEVMTHAPRDPREPLLTRNSWLTIGGFGTLIAASMLAAFAYALLVLGVDEATAVTISFLTYGFARLWHVFNMRARDSGLFTNNLVRNPYVWGAIAVCGVLLLSAVYIPFLSSLLHTVEIGPKEWAVVLIGSLTPLIVGQIGVTIAGLRRRSAA